MRNRNGRVLILGAGPAGLALAMRLLRRPGSASEVVVVEREPRVGGITASFEYEGLTFDYGSHRLHPSTPAWILRDIGGLLGPDLLKRPRNGRIRLCGRFVKFPLDPLDLMLRLHPRFLAGVCLDTLKRPFAPGRRRGDSYADVLLNGLGRTVCEAFYFPYARKLWGLAPGEISAAQARSRVSANSVAGIVRKVFLPSAGNGNGNGMKGKFYYPSKGFGQICEAMAREVRKLGGEIKLSRDVVKTNLDGDRVTGVHISPAGAKTKKSQGDSREAVQAPEEIRADIVFSTIPVTSLAGTLAPAAPAAVARAASALRYRGMVFLYLVLETGRFTPYDAHYFPESDFIFSRISEPKNYSGSGRPSGTTGLCLEIPCRPGGLIWNASAEELSDIAIRDMNAAGLPIKCRIRTRFIRRNPKIYPVYDMDHAQWFWTIDNYLKRLSGLVCLGRQALFVHDNVHHAIGMAYRAAECLGPQLDWDARRWRNYRQEFKKNTVED